MSYLSLSLEAMVLQDKTFLLLSLVADAVDFPAHIVTLYGMSNSETLERLEAFWNRSSLGRPALRVVVAPAEDEAEQPYTGPWPDDLLQRDLCPDYHRHRTQQAARRTHCLAEAMPGHHLWWGSLLTTLPVLAGGEYEYHDSAWIKEIDDILTRALPNFDPNSPAAKMLERAYLAARDGCPKDQFITPPLMLDGLSTLGMFRGFENLCTDLIDRPEWVKTWSARLTDMYIAIYEHYYRLLGYGRSQCFGGPTTPGRCEGVQCDFAVHFSPAMFEEFTLPDLRRTTEYLDRSLYHLDGTCQLRFLDQLRACPRLNGIQWNPETTALEPLKWLHAFREMRRRDFCIMIGATVDDAIEITKQIGPDGLFFCLPAFKTQDEALQAIERFEKLMV